VAKFLADLRVDEKWYLVLKTVFHIWPSVLGKEYADSWTRFGESTAKMKTVDGGLQPSVPFA
jgi:hypothetical protein